MLILPGGGACREVSAETNLYVSGEGSNQIKTVQEAINAAVQNASSTNRCFIHIKPGGRLGRSVRFLRLTVKTHQDGNDQRNEQHHREAKCHEFRALHLMVVHILTPRQALAKTNYLMAACRVRGGKHALPLRITHPRSYT